MIKDVQGAARFIFWPVMNAETGTHTGDVPGPTGDLSAWTHPVGPRGDEAEGVMLGEVRPAFLSL